MSKETIGTGNWQGIKNILNNNFTELYGAISLLAPNSKVIWFGDSEVELGLSENQWVKYYRPRGFLSWATLLSDNRLFTPLAGNKGVGGQTTTTMLTRLGSAIALNPKVVVIQASTNDRSSVFTEAVTKANYNRIINGFLSIGAKVIVLTTFPRFAGNTLIGAQETIRQNINSWIMSRTDIIPVNCEVLGLTAAHFWDGIHLTSVGAYLVGNEVAKELVKLVQPVNIADMITVDGWFNTNPYFTGTSGSKSNGATGTVASSYFLNANNIGASVVGSIVANSDGSSSQQVAISGNYTGTGKYVSLSIQGATALFANGDVVEAIAEFEIITQDANIIGIGVLADLYSSDYSVTNVNTYSHGVEDQFSSPLSAGRRYIARTPAHTVTGGTPGQMAYLVQIHLKDQAVSTPISATIKVHKMGMRKVPASIL